MAQEHEPGAVIVMSPAQLEAMLKRVVTEALAAQARNESLSTHVSVEEAARMLGRSEKTVRRYIGCGRLRASKVSGGSSPVLVERASIQALLERTTA